MTNNEMIERAERAKRKKAALGEDIAIGEYITGKEHVFTVIRNPYDFLVSCFVRR